MSKKNLKYSFDVFDTCLIRTCGEPHLVFLLMTVELYGEMAETSLKYEFVNSRIRAEKEAIKKLITLTKQDVCLEEIYGFISPSILQQFGVAELIELELKIEENVLLPIWEIKNEIEQLHHQGHNIIFISDMYLPSNFVKIQLIKFGFWLDGDSIYVSNEIGFTKSQESLYDYVASKEDIQFRNWVHKGDNRLSDYIIPMKKGINAKYFNNKSYNRYEIDWIKNSIKDIYPERGVLLAGLSKAIRLSNEPSATKDITVNIVAPLYVSFVKWVLEDASKKQIKKLYFLARDGYIFYLIANVLKQDYPEIECKYLYGSRRAFYLAGMTNYDKESFRWVMGGALGHTPRQMMQRINVDIDIMDNSLHLFSLSSDFYDIKMNEKGFELFLDLLTYKTILDEISKNAESQRKLVLAYFKQEGLISSDEKYAIVDLGWSRSCQLAINSILSPIQVHGYYFGVFENRLSINKAGNFSAAFYPEEIYSKKVKTVVTSLAFITIAEQIFAMSYHGSTICFYKDDYDNINKIKPLFDQIENESRDIDIFRNELYKYVTLYSKEFAKLYLFNYESRLLIKNYGFSALSFFILRPQKNECQLLKDFYIGNNLNDNERIIKKISLKHLLNYRKHRLIWLEGSVCLSFGYKSLFILDIIKRLTNKTRYIEFLSQIHYGFKLIR